MMKTTGKSNSIFLAFFCLIIVSIQTANAQYTMPAVMDSATLESQLDYIHERTRIYNDFRAIRDDIFLKMKRNSLDSLNGAKLDIERLNSELTERSVQIDILNSDLSRAKTERDQAIRTKDSFSFLGIQMHKTLYNTIMWVIVLGLAFVVVILFLIFKRSHTVTSTTRKELESIQEEYEDYRKNSREKYEKLVVSHHTEIMRLKRS